MTVDKIIVGDCLIKLKELEDNSVDSIVTDPPYELGFMGKSWDNSGIAYNVEMWKECLRVLKPGGHLLAFSGTRTYHRMASAIEDAGFEVRDMIEWVYGCLSEDTEVLTQRGYKQFHKLTQYDKIAVYDIKKDIHQWERPQRWSVYSVHKDTAYRIKSDYTDQIVSRNHRCLVERNGKLVFKRAENLSEVECMPTLSDDFYSLQEPNGSLLFTKLLWKSKVLAQTVFGKRIGQEVSEQGYEDGKESSVERWSNLFQKARQLSSDKICQMSTRIFRDGEKRRICDGTQTNNGSIVKQTTTKSRMCPSYQPRSTGQSTRKPDVILFKQGTQDIRRSDATITKIKYSGIIFCPTVSTGAFVARRNGQVFITGNSGFPKSLNIGKAVDKLGIRDNNKEIEFAKMLKKYKTNDVINKIDKKLGTKFRAFHFFSTPDTVRQLPSREDWVVIKEVINTNFKVGDVVYVLSGNNEIGQPTMIGNCGVISSFGTRYKVKGLDTIEVFVDFKKTDYSSEKGYYNETHVFNDYHLTKNISELNIWDEYILNRQLDLTKIREIQGYEKSIKNWDKKYIKPILNKPATEQAKQWEGWGTALKPAHEPICMARKPLAEKTVAQNVLKYGTGVINIDESRVSGEYKWRASDSKIDGDIFKQGSFGEKPNELGRFPANLIHDGSEEVRECFPDAGKGNGKGAYNYAGREYDNKDTSMFNGDKPQAPSNFNDSGSAARFFYCAKASKSERNRGCEELEEKIVNDGRQTDIDNAFQRGTTLRSNTHPTVKPIALMEYLIKMVTPKGGIVLDPFAGSGSTLVAAKQNGFQYIGIEMTEEYIPIIEARLNAVQEEKQQTSI